MPKFCPEEEYEIITVMLCYSKPHYKKKKKTNNNKYNDKNNTKKKKIGVFSIFNALLLTIVIVHPKMKILFIIYSTSCHVMYEILSFVKHLKNVCNQTVDGSH